ncbi:hypothetical protein BJY00DRAFT_58040 [Aspergillus carlsbadensis]|nr:hypothetical protein BJY00DRAFT_58040 [Aspergillus carlsbadensis]
MVSPSMENETNSLGTGELPTSMAAMTATELDKNEYEPNEELLLLQIMEATNNVASPNLEAVLDDRAGLTWPSGQRQQSPLLMERPESSGIDAMVFSFAKPAQNSRPFSLQPLRTSASVPVSHETSDQNMQAIVEYSTREQQTKSSTLLSRSTNPPIRSHSHSMERPPTSIAPAQRSNSHNPPPTGPEERPRLDLQRTAECQENQASHAEPSLGPHRQPECSIQDSESLDVFQKNHGQLDDVEEINGPPSGENLELETTCLPEAHSPHNQWKVVKRRPSDKKKVNKRGSRIPSDNKNPQVPEEVLFQQLISRLRAREESEAVASHMQREMETKVVTLQDENKTLHEEIQKLNSKLKQRTNEARAYKSQTDSWKSRLAKIKIFLNELGADYQNLRGVAIHLKATRKSLDKERKEISETIEDVKAQLARISQTSRERRGCLLESESSIASLRQELKHADERARYAQGQLADEKKRSHLLELYIQNSSRTHDKKLELVKSGQLEMTRKLEAALRAKADDCELSQVISDDFGQKVEELMALARSTAENLSNNKMDVQQYEKINAAFESRIDSTTRQLTQDIKENSNLTGKKMEDLEAQLQLFRASVSEGSALLTELSASGVRCINLESKLDETVPALERFKLGFDGLRQSEASLEQQMDRLWRSLSEAKLPEQFGQNYVHISEKLNLENEIQQLSSKLKVVEEKLEAQRVNSLEKHHELLKVTAEAHQVELNAAKFESQVTVLQEKLQAVEVKAREDQVHAIARSRDQCRADSERQLHALVMEKAAIQVNTDKIKEQLAQTQRKLAEVETSSREQRKDLESLLTERQMRIHDLEETRNECTSNLAKQEAEIAKLRGQEAVLESQQISLQLELGEANRRSDGLENERTKATTETQYSLHALQDSLSSLRSELAKKEEERDELARELENANIARKNLEASISDAKSEAHALCARVQELESEIKEVRGTLLRLNIAQLEQPLPAALAQLGAIIQSVNAKQSEQASQNSAQASIDAGCRAGQGTQTVDDAMHMNLQATEPTTPVENRGNLSSSQAGIIVPFSSILQKLDPADCLMVENEPFDISSMLIRTPERVPSTKELIVPARPEKDSPFANVESQHTIQEPQLYRPSDTQRAPVEYVQGQIHREAVVEQTLIHPKQAGSGRKVSFETRKSTVEDDDLQVPDSQVNGAQPELVVLSLSGSHPTRTNRWTYSKRQREMLTEQQKTSPCEAASSRMEDREECTETGNNKKAKTCPAASNPVSQAKTGAELFPRRTSPTRLASGSSRTRSSEAMSSQTGPGRRLRKSARQTRAEKYSARFSQGA